MWSFDVKMGSFLRNTSPASYQCLAYFGPCVTECLSQAGDSCRVHINFYTPCYTLEILCFSCISWKKMAKNSLFAQNNNQPHLRHGVLLLIPITSEQLSQVVDTSGGESFS